MDQDTVNTYNKAASAYAEKFNSIGRRIEDIERGIALCGKEDLFVIELGCGNGRDAKEIAFRANKFVGVDVSKAMIDLAREWVPGAEFVVADMLEYEIPNGVDIVFAFASFLHLDRDQVSKMLEKIHASLSDGGIVYVSVKHHDYYRLVKEDEFGPREFYFYRESDFDEMLGDKWEKVYVDEQTIRGVDWLTIALRKI